MRIGLGSGFRVLKGACYQSYNSTGTTGRLIKKSPGPYTDAKGDDNTEDYCGDDGIG